MIRCNSCNEPVTRKQALMHRAIYSLNKVWHQEHFTCIRCKCLVGYNGRPFREYRSNRNYPICIDCYMEEYHPRCNVCNKALRETCIRAMNKLWHKCCFTCVKCHSPFANGEFLIHNGKPYDIDCYYLTKYESELIPIANFYTQGSTPISDPFALDHKTAGQIPEKSTQKSQDIISELQFPPTIQNIGAGRIIRNSSSINSAAVPSTMTSVKNTSNHGEINKQTSSFPSSSKLSESYTSSMSTIKSAMPSSLTTTTAPPTTTDTAALPPSTLSESSK
ncbi:Paxillin [Dirofilaria immitis]